MSSLPDPIKIGVESGWKVTDGSSMVGNTTVECDVCIVGTGAGGGITAEIMARSGLKVVLIEEGMLKSSKDFKMREADAYPQLYQESAARKTKDKAINVLQGRTVGGSTTVNWTSSFRTPAATLNHWQKHFGLRDYTSDLLGASFAAAEKRLNVSTWTVPPNENNDILRRGCLKLGIPAAAILRNVKDCWNLGYCGMGCPTNAKQSMLVTTIPAALKEGAHLYTRCQAHHLELRGDKITALECMALSADGLSTAQARLTVKAKHYVVAGGAINSPGLLLRSRMPDPYNNLGKRTFLHPVVLSSALMANEVAGHTGAPQTIYSDHFLDSLPVEGPIGYKLEAPPIHPVIFASTLAGFGTAHSTLMKEFNRAHVLLALLRDGFHDQSQGGTVSLLPDGSPQLDYSMTDYVWDGARRALLSMAEIQFAAGAKTVYPVHEMAQDGYTTWEAAKQGIMGLPLKPLLTRVVSAHVMGGCGMSSDAKGGVVNGYGRHHQVSNLSVHDGSVFPTSIGANPQLSIYGIVTRMTSKLVEQLTGRTAAELA